MSAPFDQGKYSTYAFLMPRELQDRVMHAADPDLPQTFERRAFVRYRRPLDSLLGLLGVLPHEMTEGRVIDLSCTGIGLVLASTYPLETTLVLRLQTATQGWRSHLVRVKRCAEVQPGQFEVGCAFVKPLSVSELRAHLS